MSIELNPQQIFELRLKKEIDDILERDRRAYRDRSEEEWLNSDRPPKSRPARPMPKPAKNKPETRGSKPGIKRGHYHKTALSSSDYYADKPPTQGQP